MASASSPASTDSTRLAAPDVAGGDLDDGIDKGSDHCGDLGELLDEDHHRVVDRKNGADEARPP